MNRIWPQLTQRNRLKLISSGDAFVSVICRNIRPLCLTAPQYIRFNAAASIQQVSQVTMTIKNTFYRCFYFSVNLKLTIPSWVADNGIIWITTCTFKVTVELIPKIENLSIACLSEWLKSCVNVLKRITPCSAKRRGKLFGQIGIISSSLWKFCGDNWSMVIVWL